MSAIDKHEKIKEIEGGNFHSVSIINVLEKAIQTKSSKTEDNKPV